jgi:hypothetical protein
VINGGDRQNLKMPTRDNDTLLSGPQAESIALTQTDADTVFDAPRDNVVRFRT